MEIPTLVLLLLYLAIVLVIGVFSFFHLYHAYRFGMHTRVAYAISAAYIIGAVVIVGVTLLSVTSVDWTAPIRIELPSFGVEVTP